MLMYEAFGPRPKDTIDSEDIFQYHARQSRSGLWYCVKAIKYNFPIILDRQFTTEEKARELCDKLNNKED